MKTPPITARAYCDNTGAFRVTFSDRTIHPLPFDSLSEAQDFADLCNHKTQSLDQPETTIIHQGKSMSPNDFAKWLRGESL